MWCPFNENTINTTIHVQRSGGKSRSFRVVIKSSMRTWNLFTSQNLIIMVIPTWRECILMYIFLTQCPGQMQCLEVSSISHFSVLTEIQKLSVWTWKRQDCWFDVLVHCSWLGRVWVMAYDKTDMSCLVIVHGDTELVVKLERMGPDDSSEPEAVVGINLLRFCCNV